MTTKERLVKMKKQNWDKFIQIYNSNISDEIKEQVFKESCRDFFLFGVEDFKNQVEKR